MSTDVAETRHEYLSEHSRPVTQIVTEGGVPLRGRVRVGGAKSAALPIMAAALLTDEPCVIENVPVLRDIFVMADLLRHLGAEVEFDTEQHRVRVHAHVLKQLSAPAELVESMRAS